ncbi:MAG: ATP phosphoribosyltransferase regulatory subunit, partial [Bacteroidota bacterium]
FYQCDVDVVGSDSLMYEAELIQIYDEVFSTLDLNVEIKVNHRKVLAGIAEIAGIGNHFSTFAVAVDKLDKLPRVKVIEEMQRGGISESSAARALELISMGRSDLSDVLRTSEVGMEGLRELDSLHVYLDKINIQNKILFDATLARGLSYYTGCIFEVKSTDVTMGSIGGGGRYADLTGIFGLKGVSGVGISFGAERIYDVMEELNLFDSLQIGQTTAIILAFDQDSHEHGFILASKLRKLDIATDIYPEAAKFKKQMKYAGNGTYRYAILVGSEELSTQVYTVKELSSGDQQKCTLDQLIELLQSVS